MRAWVNALRTCGFLIDGARDADLVPRSPGGAGAISRGDHGANTRAGPAAADATAQGSGIVTVGHALDNARATARSAPSHHISSTPRGHKIGRLAAQYVADLVRNTSWTRRQVRQSRLVHRMRAPLSIFPR